MLLAIENILTTGELANTRELFATAQFVDGRVTAGELAAKVKNNLQLDANAPETQALTGIVHNALQSVVCFRCLAEGGLPTAV